MTEPTIDVAEAFGAVKPCPHCGGERYLKPHASGYTRKFCPPCEAKWQKEWREKNKDRCQQNAKKYMATEEGRKKAYASARAWRDRNPNFVKDYAKKNEVSIKAKSKARRARDKEKLSAKAKENYKKNARKIAEKNAAKRKERAIAYKKWSSTPQGKAVLMAIKMKRRSNMEGVEHTLTVKQIHALWNSFDNCLYCGIGKVQALDHVMPVSKKGPTNIENMAPVCKQCNSRKKDSTLEQWMGRCDLHIYPLPRFPLIPA